MISNFWDYLVITASHEEQASAYRAQIDLRQKLGLIPRARNVLAVADPGGKRIGSGGSTIYSLLQVLSRELPDSSSILDPQAWLATLSKLRILIVHGGGDSRRLPAYGACGKIFIPVPGESDRALGMTLLDRQLPVYLGLPPAPSGRGQTIITSGDVLLDFDNTRARFADQGITGLGCYASPDLASRHGVFCPDAGGKVRLYLQKPSPAEQSEKKAVHRHGQAVLDIGVMSFDAVTAVRLLSLCKITRGPGRELAWTGPMARAIQESGLDFYREVCCALGTEANLEDYLRAVRASGSAMEEAQLRCVFKKLEGVPFSVSVLPRCGFLHFGTSRQLIQSGTDLLRIDFGTSRADSCLNINNEIDENGLISGALSWVEGCRVQAPLTLGGENVVVGVDVRQPLSLPARSVLDVIEGRDRKNRQVWFVRCYGIDDVFHKPADQGARLAGLSLRDWLRAMDAAEDDLWSKETPSRERLVWNARVFPASTTPEGFRDWLWMFTPAAVSPGQRAAWRAADRFSFAEMLGLASQEEFHRRRLVHHAGEIRANLMQKFRLESGFSASELAFILTLLNPERRAQWVAEILQQCSLHFGGGEPAPGLERLELSRILHTLGSAIQKGAAEGDNSWKTLADDVFARLSGKGRNFLASLGLTSGLPDEVQTWTKTLRDKAFENIGRTIVMSREKPPVFPRNALRADEIIWGRAPARLDLGGGWSDTPPYALENGGCVINAAVNLNGQPPIHAYARVIEEPEIRISSIDHGVQIVIRELAELMDYRSPVSKFGLAKATLALCGFAPETAAWPREAKTLREMLELFGGGIELTTLAAIPSGSGLGTSSIMGAVLVAVVHRMVGRPLQTRELFHNVLRLEQELTTGGGWQDQVGGVLTGVKMITTEPGLVPNPCIQYVPPDVLDPRANGGQTLLYYTGLRRLAKNILRDVVGSYLDRDRTAMETLRQIHAFPPRVLEAMAAKNIERFGEVLGAAWDLKKQIDPASTTEVIEKILNRVGRLIHGAKLMGAGGGGFLLLVCRSAEAARAVRQELENDPPNDRARFFEFDISLEGLAVTAS